MELWFAIYCNQDDSHSVVSKDSVVCNNPLMVKKNDFVKFYHGKRQYEGIVKDTNEDYSKMYELIQKLNSHKKKDDSFHAERPRKSALKSKQKLKQMVAGNQADKKSIEKEKSTAGGSGKKKCSTKNSVMKMLPKVPSLKTNEKRGKCLTPPTEPSEHDNNATDVSDSHSSDTELTAKEMRILKKALAEQNKDDVDELVKLQKSSSIAINPKKDESQSSIDSGEGDLTASGLKSKKTVHHAFKASNFPFDDLSDEKIEDDNESHRSEGSLPQPPSIFNSGPMEQFTDSSDTIKISEHIDSDFDSNATREDNDEDTDQSDADSVAQKKKKRNHPREYQGIMFLKKCADENVVELWKDSIVFVKKSSLSRVKNSTTSARALARRLLDIVFTKEALLACSLTGNPANGKGKGQIAIRSPLAEAGVQAIIKYVTARARTHKRMGRYDKASLNTSMASKLCEDRSKALLNAAAQASKQYEERS